MTQFDKFALTRRDALRRGLAGVAASGALFGVTGSAFADDTLAEIKKRGVLSTATEMQFPPFDISDNGTYKGLDRDLVDAVGKEMGAQGHLSRSAVDQRSAWARSEEVRPLHRAGDHHQGAHEALRVHGSDC